MNKSLLGIVSVLLLASTACNNSNETQLQAKCDSLSDVIETLQQQNEKLTKEVEEYENTPARLNNDANKLIADKDIYGLQTLLNKAEKYHPEAKETAYIKKELAKLQEEHEKYIRQQKAKLEKQIEEEKKKAAQEEAKRLSAVKKLKKEYDDVSGITWYKNPYFTHYNNRNLTSIYIGQSGSSVWLRLKMSYHGEDWIFFEKAYLSYDGNTQEILFDKYEDKKTDNYTDVWEWIDVSVSNSTLSFLRKMVDGKQPKMRLSGKYTKTRNLSPNEIKSIKDVLLAYDVLKEGE